jgi:hypothetical protein
MAQAYTAGGKGFCRKQTEGGGGGEEKTCELDGEVKGVIELYMRGAIEYLQPAMSDK